MSWARLQVGHKQFERKQDATLWSPVIVSDLARKSASVTHVTALVYDFDHGAEWDDVVGVAVAFRLRHWAYSTFQHTEEAHRFRLVLAVDEAIPADLYPRVWRGFADMVGWPVDEACKDLARMYYVPSCPIGSIGDQSFGDGDGINWRAWLDVWAAVEEPAPRPADRLESATRNRIIESTERTTEINRIILRRMFEGIGPDSAYHQWIFLGMIAKDLGMEAEWSSWCARGSKYRAGEPERKLRSFQR